MTERSRGISVAAACVIAGVLLTTRGAVGFGMQRYPVYRLSPVDEGPGDPLLLSFRARLLDLIRQKDGKALFEIMTPAVRDGFASVPDDPLLFPWEQLERLLLHGGLFTTELGREPGRREFCAPYAYVRRWQAERVAVQIMEAGDAVAWVVLGSGVRVRERPSINAKILGHLSHQLVPVSDIDARDEAGASRVWQSVMMPDGRWGYVESSLLWGDRDYHACFARIEDKWRMTTFDRMPH